MAAGARFGFRPISVFSTPFCTGPMGTNSIAIVVFRIGGSTVELNFCRLVPIRVARLPLGETRKTASEYEPSDNQMNPVAERHYRVRELATLWGFSANTIIRLFATEEGVIRLVSGIGKRKYVTLSIPESIALRVHERLGREALQAQLPHPNPLRVIRLRDLNSGMAKRPRDVIKLKTG
jgi:hypothetical protein